MAYRIITDEEIQEFQRNNRYESQQLNDTLISNSILHIFLDKERNSHSSKIGWYIIVWKVIQEDKSEIKYCGEIEVHQCAIEQYSKFFPFLFYDDLKD